MADALDKLVSANSGSQPNRTAATASNQENTQDLLNQLVQGQKQIQDLYKTQQEVPGVGDKLGSLQGILALLGAGGAAAAGAPEAGAGLLQGFVGQVQQGQAAEQARIGAQREEAMTLLEANKQRLTTMLTNRPEMFVDEEGNSLVDPRVLMYASTGMMMPINPGINYKLSKQTDKTKFMVETGATLMLQGDTPAKRKQGATMINKALGLQLDDQFFVDIAGMDETSAWDSLLGKKELDTVATLHAWEYARQNGLSLQDPKIISMLSKSAEPAGGPTSIDEYELNRLGYFNKQVEAMGPAVQAMGLMDQLDVVFGGTMEGDAALLKRLFAGTDAFNTGLSGQYMANILLNAGQLLTSVWTASNGQSPWLKKMGINTVEDIYSSKGVGAIVDSAVAWSQQAMSDAFAQNQGISIRMIAERVATDYEDVTLGSAFEAAAQIMEKIKAMPDVTSTTGRVDVDAFNKKVQAYVDGELEISLE